MGAEEPACPIGTLGCLHGGGWPSANSIEERVPGCCVRVCLPLYYVRAPATGIHPAFNIKCCKALHV